MQKIENNIFKPDKEIVNDFESKFSKLVGKGKSVSFSAGRMGFYALMKILKIGKGDEVILQGHTCSVMANAILRIGSTPIYADIDPDTFGSSASEIKKVISNKTKLIVAQHSFGIPCAIDPIVSLAKENNIFLLEDCATALGSKINNNYVGNFGDAALFSIDHSKPINSFTGGIIYSKNDYVYNKMKKEQEASQSLSLKRQKSIYKRFLFENKYYNPIKYGKSFLIDYINSLTLNNEDSYLTDDSGTEILNNYPYPSKLPEFIAQIGIFELARWEREKIKRKKLLTKYLEISKVLGISEFIPKAYSNKNLEIIPLRFIFTHPDAKLIRLKMSKFIDVSWFWYLTPLESCSSPEMLGYKTGSCPISEAVCNTIINWPCVFNEEDNKNLLKHFKIIHKK